MDNNFNEYVREETEITVMGIIMENIKTVAGHVGAVFKCVAPKEHCRRELKSGKQKTKKKS
jgi:hypothetical protein